MESYNIRIVLFPIVLFSFSDHTHFSAKGNQKQGVWRIQETEFQVRYLMEKMDLQSGFTGSNTRIVLRIVFMNAHENRTWLVLMAYYIYYRSVPEGASHSFQ